MEYTIILKSFDFLTNEWVGLQVWSMSDDLESSVFCYELKFYEWDTEEDKQGQLESLESLHNE